MRGRATNRKGRLPSVPSLKYLVAPAGRSLFFAEQAAQRDQLTLEHAHKIGVGHCRNPFGQAFVHHGAARLGRKGQNARLTSRLIGWRLDIEEFKAMGDNPRQTAIDSLTKAFAVDVDMLYREAADLDQ